MNPEAKSFERLLTLYDGGFIIFQINPPFHMLLSVKKARKTKMDIETTEGTINEAEVKWAVA
ncbi:hypothetical protein D6853_08325 [Butyrivibrio sp. X503]|nr:hypothetical protein D6853_08325 [Butyrivibrio sp. X503]